MRRAWPVLVVGLAVVLASCSHSASGGEGAAAPSTAAPSEVLAAFGSTAGYGSGLADSLRDAWPQLLFHESFPLSTVLFNWSVDPLTFESAVELELRSAVEQHPTVAAIWLGPDAPGGCSTNSGAPAFEPALTALVKPLRESGARVIVGNLPAGVPCAVAFNAAVMNVARVQHATVADVASALEATPAVGPDSSVTPAESRAIASAFGAAIAGA